MVEGLPDRPLSFPETWSLSESGPIQLALPGAPESIHYDGEGKRWIHDLILFTDSFTAAFAFDETGGEWVFIARAEGGTFL